MDQSLLSSRAIVGSYYAALEADNGAGWLDMVSNLYGSDQASETYNWLGQTPAMREWLGGRQAKGFSGQGVTIINKHYEATLEIQKKDLRRDKTGQINARVAEFAQRGQTHWASLLSTAIVNGLTTTCYDGQYFFDTDHSEGDSGAQSNKIQVDISAMPGQVHGSVTAPSNEEAQAAIIKGITAIQSFVDDRGEPMNEFATSFVIQSGMGLYPHLAAGLSSVLTSPALNNVNPRLLANFTIELAPNPRLNSWTDQFAIFRTDAPTKALIRQSEQDVELKVKAEGSEFEFDNDAWQFGIDAWRGVGYGHWQRACHVTLI